ncbi:MAG: ABC transporter ATP-binding protein [Peptococcaceae bacterium]
MLKLFGSLKQYSIFIALVLILVFFQSLSQLYLPTLMSDIVDVGIIQGDINYILRIGLLMLLVALVGMVCTIAASFLSSKIAIGFSKDLREKIFTKVENFSLQEFDKLGTSSLITRTTNDITQIERVVMLILRMLISAPMMFIGGVIMAVSKDARLSLVIVVAIPILFITIIILTRKGIPLFKAVQQKLDKLNLVSREGLTGIRVIRAFNRDDYEKKRFYDANYDLTSISIRVNQIMAALMPIIMLVMNFTTIAVIWFGGIRIDNGYMQVGDLMAFIQYVMQIMFSLIMVSMMFIMIPRAAVSVARVNEVLDSFTEIKNPEKAQNNNFKGVVEFRNVTFSYPGAEKPVLYNVSFTAKPGTTTAIIGGTGMGKSTLISLIPRFYDVNSGSIMIDGVDIRQISQEKLRSVIGFVPQKAVLFTGSVADNIRFGKGNATEGEVREAAVTAQAMEFIDEMEEGFNSLVIQGGNNLSGGQKQRLAIARALVRKPPIYIFDDSFSALDFKTDAKLREALKERTGDAAMIIVAQRVSTVMNADQIVVLDEGRIAGIGKHRELLNTCEVYREIVSSQLAEEELA